MPPSPPPSGFNFAFDTSLSDFNVPVQSYISTHSQYDDIVVGAIVFATGVEEKILLLQRAEHDSMPLRWETPGGAVDNEDETIIHGVVRELWEESGLLAKRVVRQVGVGQVFRGRDGQRAVKYTFEVELHEGNEETPKVTIDPDEHEDFLWVSENEVHKHRAVGATSSGQEAIDFKTTTLAQEQIILESFRLRRGEVPMLTDFLGS